MAKKKEISVEDKLRALYDLQLIDSRIDEIKNLRGELPLEVEDLENEIAGLVTKLDKVKAEVQEYDLGITEQKQIIETAKELLKKYEEKLKNVRNNREYNSIVKEQEFQDLESQLAEKKIKEAVAEESSSEISTSTFITDEGSGKINQQALSSATKKTCESLINKLLFNKK